MSQKANPSKIIRMILELNPDLSMEDATEAYKAMKNASEKKKDKK